MKSEKMNTNFTEHIHISQIQRMTRKYIFKQIYAFPSHQTGWNNPLKFEIKAFKTAK